jgi:hypothetical protein
MSESDALLLGFGADLADDVVEEDFAGAAIADPDAGAELAAGAGAGFGAGVEEAAELAAGAAIVLEAGAELAAVESDFLLLFDFDDVVLASVAGVAASGLAEAEFVAGADPEAGAVDASAFLAFFLDFLVVEVEDEEVEL